MNSLPASPYKGLAPFGDSDLDELFFFGRERDSEIVVANLQAARLTVLYGASGVGKSSLLAASVARRLREEPDADVTVFSSWSGDPTAPLRTAQEAADSGREAYLILDQFEEYFLYHGDEEDEGTLAEELPELLGRTDHRVNVLISVREDALALLDAFKARIPNVLANYLRLPHLDRAAGEAAITKPLERWSELAGEDERIGIEPELVGAVLDETATGRVELGGVGVGADPGSDGGGGQIEAPILQLVMERLWQAEREEGSRVLRLGTLRAMGGSGQIVRGHLERALASLTPAQQDVAASIFDHLVTPSGSKIALRSADLADYAGVPTDELAPVVGALARERILRSVEGSGGGDERYEIFHDVLADAVLAWRAERRVERERQSAARRHRRLLAFAVATLIALAAVSAVAVFALVERDNARKHERSATARELQASALLGLGEGDDRALSDALRAARLEPDARSETVLRQVLVQSRLRRALPAPAPVSSLQFSGGRRLLLVAGGSRRILLYDPDTGGLVRSFSDPAEVTAAVLGPRDLVLSGDKDGGARLRRTTSSSVLQTVPGKGPVTSLAFGARGRLLLVTTRGGTAAVVRTGGGLVHRLRQPGPVTRGVFAPSGRLVATVALDRELHSLARIYDVASGRLLHVLPALGIQDVDFSPDGSLLATASADGTIGLWDPLSGKQVDLLYDGGKDVNDVAFSPDGSLLAGGYTDGGTRVWTVATGQRLYKLEGHTTGVVAVAWSPDGRVLADASKDRTAHLYGIAGLVAEGGTIAILPGNAGGTSALAFAPGGKRLATGGQDGGVRLWDARPEELFVPLGFHRDGAVTASYSPDGRLALSAGADGIARIWDMRTRRAVHVLTTPAALRDASFSPDGAQVVTAGDDGAARVWNTEDGNLLRTFRGSSPLRVARFSPDGELLVTGSEDGTSVVWRVADGKRLHTLGLGKPVVDTEFSPDGSLVATAAGRRVVLWSVADGERVHDLRTKADVLALAFAPDGGQLATGELLGRATLWDVDTGRVVRELRRHGVNSRVTDVVFSPEGDVLLTTSSDNDGRTWVVASGTSQRLLRGQGGALATGAFSPDGRWIVTAGPVTAALWPPGAEQPLLYLRGPEGRLTDVSFSPDGKHVLSASEDGGVRTYNCEDCGDLASLDALAQARLEHSGLAGSSG